MHSGYAHNRVWPNPFFSSYSVAPLIHSKDLELYAGNEVVIFSVIGV